MKSKLTNSFIIVAATLLSAFFLYQYGKSKETFYGDALGYYLYLPSTFVHHNIKTPFTTPEAHLSQGIRWSMGVIKGAQNEKGFYLNQYTYGVALMEAPFFFVAHIYEKMNGLDATGYSNTYNYLLKAGTLLYAFLGLVLVYKILRRYFGSILSLVSVVSIFLCTNLFWFSIFQAGMAHVPLFFLYALLVHLTIKVYEKPSWVLFILIGVVAGIITLIRPTDIICLLIPLLYDVYNKETWHKKWTFIKAHIANMMALAVAFVLPIIPQLLYWKSITGSYFCYSYGDQSFDFRHPKIIEGLFYFSNGWLPYSPIMVCSLLGMLFYKTLKQWKWCIAVIFAIYVYVIYSWYCYYYLNGLGSRPMIHLYPLLALPLTAFFRYISERKALVKVSFVTLCLFLCSVNLCFSVQELLGVIDSPDSNMAFTLQMLYRTKLTYNDLVVKSIGEWQPNNVEKVRTLAYEDFEKPLSEDYIKDTVGGSKYIYHWHDQDYLEVAVVPYSKARFEGAKWFKCSGKFMCPNTLDYYRHLMVLDINNQEKLWRGFKIENNIRDSSVPITMNRCVANKWDNLSFYAKIPRNLKEGDVIKLIMWITDKRDIYMDDLRIDLYK